jgi:hypothetical protein
MLEKQKYYYYTKQISTINDLLWQWVTHVKTPTLQHFKTLTH